jgi:hypothetical protein
MAVRPTNAVRELVLKIRERCNIGGEPLLVGSDQIGLAATVFNRTGAGVTFSLQIKETLVDCTDLFPTVESDLSGRRRG